jgi:hypothetical protein
VCPPPAGLEKRSGPSHYAVIRAESSYRPQREIARRRLRPDAADAGHCAAVRRLRHLGPGAEHILGGTAYLKFLFDRLDGDLRLVLAAYNAGEGAVTKHGNRVPPYWETQGYVRRVLGYLGIG